MYVISPDHHEIMSFETHDFFSPCFIGEGHEAREGK